MIELSARLFRWCLLAAVFSGAQLWAYDLKKGEGGTYVVTWPVGDVPMKVMLPTHHILIDGSTHRGSFLAAMAEWNEVLGVVRLVAGAETSGSYGVFNNVSEVVMDSSIDGFDFGPNTLAVAVSNDDFNTRIESDIIFNTAFQWDSYRGDLRSNAEDIRRVAIHELGHSLSLLHPDQAEPPQDVAAIMNSVVSDVDGLLADDIAGVQYLYGVPGATLANDDFGDATVLPFVALGNTILANSIGATKEDGEPGHAGGIGGHSVWWTWTPTIGGEVDISTLGSSFDTVLSVYTGETINTLTTVAENDDQSTGVVRTSALTFTAVADTTYYIAVDGWEDYYGQITLNVSVIRPPGFPAITQQPQKAYGANGGSAAFSVVADGTQPFSYQWQGRATADDPWVDLADGASVSGATSDQLRVSDLPLPQSLFRAKVTNAIGTVYSDEAELEILNAAPVIQSHTGDQELWQGEQLQLSVVVSNPDQAVYQWYFNGVAIEGYEATRATYAINNVQPEHAGVYHVVVGLRFNTGYRDTSASITVSILLEGGGVRVASGTTHTIFLRQSGRLVGMGEARDYQLGTTDQPETVYDPMGTLSDVLALTAAEQHSLVIRTDNDLWGFGWDWGHLVVTNDRIDQPPTELMSDVSQVVTEREHTAVILRNGEVWAWGGLAEKRAFLIANRANDIAVSAGSVMYIDPDGNLYEVSKDTLNSDYHSPNLIMTDCERIYLRYSHIWIIKRDGSLWRFKGGFRGGYENSGITGVVDVALGRDHTLLLKDDASLWGVGQSSNGELGRSALNIAVPQLIASDVVTMSAGRSHSHFVKNDGSLWATGMNTFGQLGTGDMNTQYSPVKVAEGEVSEAAAPTGLQIDYEDGTGMRLTWDGMSAASYYQVWRGVSDDVSAATLVADHREGTMWYDGAAEVGASHYYWVRAVNPAGPGAFSAAVSGTLPGIAPQFSLSPISAVVRAGGGLTLTVEVSGFPTPTLQWFFDDEPIPGATGLSLEIAELVASDTGAYRVEATNALGTFSSETADIRVGATSSDYTATHALVTTAPLEGEPLQVQFTLSGEIPLTALQWCVLLPAGWSFVEDDLGAVDQRPSADQTELLEWTWTTPPVLPLEFSVTLDSPMVPVIEHELVSLIEIGQTSPATLILAQPDPLMVILRAASHAADTDRDFRINLSELLRVIELYNTRHGTMRTGRYHLGEGTVDGYAPDTSTTGSHNPGRYHSADTNQDGMVSLGELLRVIEIYNTRSGTTRTGGYRRGSNTVDGFEPDPTTGG